MRSITLLIYLFLTPWLSAGEPSSPTAELDQFWAKVSKAVGTGDFESYRETCHPDAVLVSGSKETAYPLSEALTRWKREFDDTRDGKMNASVSFRFSHRYGDEKSAHESGMFLYRSQKPGDEPSLEYIHFEALLVKKAGHWSLLMEYQKAVGTAEEWNALALETP